MLKIGKENIIITIGEYGVIFTLHKKSGISQKLIIKEFNKENAKKINEIFNKNKHCNAYILLDTVDQSYKKKDYPNIKKNDLKHLIQRDLKAEITQDSILDYFILNEKIDKENPKNKKDKKWTCLFVSASISKITQQCIDFIGQTNNRLIGIYMLPIESQNLFQNLKESIKSSSKMKDKKCDIYCLITQTKVSGIRQSIFYNNQMIFTRVLDYNSLDKNFVTKYESDLQALLEYVKRIFPEIEISELETVNILPEQAIKKIKEIKNINYDFINYTPHKAGLIALKKSEISENSSACDLIFSRIFFESKKHILKFSTFRVRYVEKMFYVMQFSYFANLISIIGIGILILYLLSTINIVQEKKTLEKSFKLSAIQNLNKIKSKALDGSEVIDTKTNEIIEIDKIVDFGKINERISKYEKIILNRYSSLKFIREYPARIQQLEISLEGFDKEKITSRKKLRLNSKLELLNPSGDIERLFEEFDALNLAIEKNYKKNNKLTISELPKNIDFAQKYYNFNMDFSFEENIR